MTVWTISLPKPEKPEEQKDLGKCCRIMTVGKDYRDGDKWIKNRKRIPCPERATRLIEGKPYCAMHSHKVRRKPPD